MGCPFSKSRGWAIRCFANARGRSTSPTLRNPLLQKLIDDMIETMHEYHGVGLAAPQVHEGIRLFVGLLDEEPIPKSEAIALINPEITPDGRDAGRVGGLPQHPDIRGMVRATPRSSSRRSTATAGRSSCG